MIYYCSMDAYFNIISEFYYSALQSTIFKLNAFSNVYICFALQVCFRGCFRGKCFSNVIAMTLKHTFFNLWRLVSSYPVLNNLIPDIL